MNRNEGSLIVNLIKSLINAQLDLGHDYIFDLLVIVTINIFKGINEEKVKEFYLKNVNKSDEQAVEMAFYDFLGDLVLKCPTY